MPFGGRAPQYGKDQTSKMTQTNPDDTARGGLKTPMYGKGKITHMTPNYPEPGSPPNTMGHQHVNTSGKGKKKG